MTRFGRRTSGFTESVIRGMSTLAREHNAINLAQGFPDFPAPQELKDAAARAIASDVNQYAITWGSRRLREALARKYDEWYGMRVDPETDITVTCGSTEAMVASLMALLEPGDEVIVFDPFYENYGPDAILAGASLRHLPLAPGAQLDLDLLARAFSPKTRAIILNSPANPSGKVFSRVELEAIAAVGSMFTTVSASIVSTIPAGRSAVSSCARTAMRRACSAVSRRTMRRRYRRQPTSPQNWTRGGSEIAAPSITSKNSRSWKPRLRANMLLGNTLIFVFSSRTPPL